MSKGSAISSFGPAISGTRTQHCLTRRTQHCLATANPDCSWGSGGLPPASQRNKEKKELPPSHPRRRALLASAPSSLSFYWERRALSLCPFPELPPFYSTRAPSLPPAWCSLSPTPSELPICTHDCQPRIQLGVRGLAPGFSRKENKPPAAPRYLSLG